jgi:hypothetical protein
MRMTPENIQAKLNVGDSVMLDNQGPFKVTFLYGGIDLGFRVNEYVSVGEHSDNSKVICSSDVKNPKVMIELLGFTD